MKLLIVESPAKAKTISKYLNDAYTVRASVGHVRDLPKSNKDAIDIEGGFVPRYVTVQGKEHIISELRDLAKKANEVVLATDPDREGEAIAWHLFEALKLDSKKTKRITFNEITKEAVQEAMKHPRAIDEHLRAAQEARRVLDRLVGYDLSGLIWKKVRYGLSAGRVQSPALRILMEREREIRAFVPENFWVITALLEDGKKHALTFTCTEEPDSEKEAERIVAAGKAGAWSVADVSETGMKRAPRPPFTTSTLQQAASTRLGFSPSRTMQVAQKLYEAGHITYMRTDSPALSSTAIGPITAAISKEFGKDLVEVRAYKTKSKSAQEAHEAIRPTAIGKRVAGATDEQKKLYRLIWERTVASQMKDAQILRTRITAAVAPKGNDRPVPDFSVTGSRVVSPGWLLADPAARGEDVELPKLAAGDPLTLKDIASEGKQTQPPNRYTEAGLVKELEKRGIGRPSTYASIMKTLQDRGYVIKEGKTLIPTDVGDVVSSFLENNFTQYVSDSFTAEMEDELDDIAEGKREYEKTLREFYAPFVKEVKSKEHIDKLTTLGDAPKEFTCPLCGASMVFKLGTTGKFMSCARFPECTGARRADGSEIHNEGTVLGSDPETTLPVIVLDGRFGPYVQLGETPKEKKRGAPKPRRAGIPADMDPATITLDEALKLLSLPRALGAHPETGKEIVANIGRFGPYVLHDGDFRSLKEHSPYTITLSEALAIFKEPKVGRKGEKILREVGPHPRTGKMIKVFESKSGKYLKRGFKRVPVPENIDVDAMTPEVAIEILKNA